MRWLVFLKSLPAHVSQTSTPAAEYRCARYHSSLHKTFLLNTPTQLVNQGTCWVCVMPVQHFPQLLQPTGTKATTFVLFQQTPVELFESSYKNCHCATGADQIDTVFRGKPEENTTLIRFNLSCFRGCGNSVLSWQSLWSKRPLALTLRCEQLVN